MFIVWFFWLFVLLGGWGMGLGAVRTGLATGFTADVVANVVVWLGCGIYAVPRVRKLAAAPRRGPAGH